MRTFSGRNPRPVHPEGIEPPNVWITIGQGAHTPMDRADLIRKLGLPVVEKVAVHQNLPYEHREFLGQTREAGAPRRHQRDFRHGEGAIQHDQCDQEQDFHGAIRSAKWKGCLEW